MFDGSRPDGPHDTVEPRSTSSTFVRKKAALTLLRLYRKHPTVLPVADWAERIISLMDDRDPVSLLAATCSLKS